MTFNVFFFVFLLLLPINIVVVAIGPVSSSISTFIFIPEFKDPWDWIIKIGKLFTSFYQHIFLLFDLFSTSGINGNSRLIKKSSFKPGNLIGWPNNSLCNCGNCIFP